ASDIDPGLAIAPADVIRNLLCDPIPAGLFYSSICPQKDPVTAKIALYRVGAPGPSRPTWSGAQLPASDYPTHAGQTLPRAARWQASVWDDGLAGRRYGSPMPATPAWPPRSAPRLFVLGPLSAANPLVIDGP